MKKLLITLNGKATYDLAVRAVTKEVMEKITSLVLGFQPAQSPEAAPAPAAVLNAEQVAHVRGLMPNNKINAIKYVREATNLDLKAAVDALTVQ